MVLGSDETEDEGLNLEPKAKVVKRFLLRAKAEQTAC